MRLKVTVTRLVTGYGPCVSMLWAVLEVLVRLIQYIDSRAIIMKHIVEREYLHIVEREFRSIYEICGT